MKNKPELNYKEAEEALVEALDNDTYAVYNPENFVDDGKIHGHLITEDGYVLTFITEPEWGPAEASATYQSHVEDDDCDEKWVRLYEEAEEEENG